MNKTGMDWTMIGHGYAPRAVYASHPDKSLGRLVFENKENGKLNGIRSSFQRDRDRIIHSSAFRRLRHKTQVFVAHEDDYYRTRLTHTIEVSQIARVLARALRLDEELTEAIALGHDLGHPPFGHAGEKALNMAIKQWSQKHRAGEAEYLDDGFDHNTQTLRIVTMIEQHYPQFHGLNLSWETLEGLVKHNGPFIKDGQHLQKIPRSIVEFNKKFDLKLDHFPGAEAQCAALADDIAYNAHDIDDGLRAGFISLKQLAELKLTGEIILSIKNDYGNLDSDFIVYELVRRQIKIMVEDVIAESLDRLSIIQPQNTRDIYCSSRALISFSDKMQPMLAELKQFLLKNFYQHDVVRHRCDIGEQVLTDLFNSYIHDPAILPEKWLRQAEMMTLEEKIRLIADFLSGMTDHYALRKHESLFGYKIGLLDPDRNISNDEI